ncbi:LacI family transcriptional regulator [Parabacteroides sp. PF5-5]|uniref:AraC family transcriptional regulator n=1 Tax=unclassified Parabacteroides TaxID=2649774 RepID=UPI002472ECB3|nr:MULTISPECIES: DNA-binding transcriptional regulator [unclassified Parabacteroides]MDH6304453.1 LacI family transcriptional regulator [Parabacteroides sp. PH5-39]MDH6315394.1 LacI family transcriptional regulator [Parabacteroides sp. PF5-13]MDH6319112.1 LacI family transcriptional regulator [Parabacteroides sp. PH5-13]MDH6322842.1 LacI family transcriptional regulator [Parabacteroides sp. PH5-8]MDH6326586.1 LacI family transcriptional regulator [Parabacteroides sp. PH5-41]
MARVILLTDFSEEYAKLLLKGIVNYSKEHEPWVLCKMPHSYREKHGLNGVLEWALKWKADAIIAQFFPTDEVSIFKKNGIIAIAQDFKNRFTEIPNITGAHYLAGKMGANYFIQKGFKNFAFYGFKNIVWSEERCEGFRDELSKQLPESSFYEYQNANQTDLWYYESDMLIKWLQVLPKPVGIMACDDNQGHHITEICKQYGIQVPEKVAVLGVDNDEAICTLSGPPLSSINQAVEKGGYETAELIDKMLQNRTWIPEDIVVMPTHIITRQSTDIYATEDKSIAIVLKHIHQHSDRKLSVDELVRLVPLSRRLLETRFKEVTGMPIYTYILNLRIDKFAQKLIESNAPIVEIASQIGFADYKNIARLFKRVKGCSPSEYRAMFS